MKTQIEQLARRSTIHHPSGLCFRTPLLVPSFSSKGLRITGSRSELREIFELTAEWLTDTMLISAYDLAHGLIPRPEDLPATPELIIVDSGGYEARVEHDLSTAVHTPHEPLPWSEDQYRGELDRWPARFSAAFVSYDHPSQILSVSEQVERAQELFATFPGHLYTFLLKPETSGQVNLTSALETVASSPEQLLSFDFIGVTDKELGGSMLDRMENVASLRRTLDKAGNNAPIHVFGALDPLSCVLLFLAGAEVFDGLTWLRYAFREGLCIYSQNYGALDVGIKHRETRVRAKMLTDNVHYLSGLATQMENFLLDRDFSQFKHHSAFLAREFDTLRSRLQEDE